MVKADANERGTVHGDMENSLLWMGQSAALVDDIPTASELIARMVAQAQEASLRLSTAVRS